MGFIYTAHTYGQAEEASQGFKAYTLTLGAVRMHSQRAGIILDVGSGCDGIEVAGDGFRGVQVPCGALVPEAALHLAAIGIGVELPPRLQITCVAEHDFLA